MAGATERELVTAAVKRGENAGQTLAHGPVGRSLSMLGKVDRLPFTTTASWSWIARGSASSCAQWSSCSGLAADRFSAPQSLALGR